jgi:hypothetical protein
MLSSGLNFLGKEIDAKAFQKMLVKLTTIILIEILQHKYFQDTTYVAQSKVH